MSDSLRPAWVIANQGQRLVNIETGTILEKARDPSKTTVWQTNRSPILDIATIDEPLDKIIKTMTRQGYVLKLL